MKTQRLLTAALFLLCAPALIGAQGGDAKKTEVLGHTMVTLLEPGAIPAIFEPEFIPASEADSFYYADEPLMVVIGGEEAKGYSTWHLDRHEIVNDYLGGTAIAVTW